MSFRMGRWASSLLVAAYGFIVAQPAVAADAWPAHPVRVIVPYAPGNTGDITFRIIQTQLEERFGQRFLIDNKSGASGNIGAQEVTRAKPDGYTLLLGATNNYVTNQFLFKGLGFDPTKDLVPITMISNAPSVFVVNANVPAKSLKEFTSLAAKQPGRFSFASPGAGTPPHLAAALYEQLAGIELLHVPYRGSPPAVQGLIGNETQLYVTAFSSVAGNVSAGRLRPLAVAGTQRLALLPDVPTTAEQGLPDLVTGNWWGLSAPVGTPPAIVEKLASAVREVLADPDVQQKFRDLGLVTVGNTPEQFSAQIAKEANHWKRVIEKGNIELE